MTQRVVAQVGAHLDALGAALAVGRVDEDAELGRLEAAPLGHDRVLLRRREMRTQLSGASTSGSVCWAAKAAMRSLSAARGWAVPRMAVSGQA